MVLPSGVPPADGGLHVVKVAKALAKIGERSESSSRPQLARAELLDKAIRVRFESEIDAALKAMTPGGSK